MKNNFFGYLDVKLDLNNSTCQSLIEPKNEKRIFKEMISVYAEVLNNKTRTIHISSKR